ncbi:MAG TPA: ECF-type sigma factor [Bryobacteraceae bacterium]|jgi:RNA polymerase sigma factor (TIGR02999 family)|nr:ECF-type sigma factor [Bryobacteraceae bacterium]
MTNENEDQDLTALLAAAADGDAVAREQFIEATYRNLHRLAERMMSSEKPGATIQPTALVNEALLRLFSGKTLQANDRKHFLNIAAQQMRRVLIDRARSHGAAKRKGAAIPIEDAGFVPVERSAELIALDDALNALAQVDPAAADVVERKYFGGYTDEETAAILGVNIAQIRRDWTYARAWLHDYLSQT